MKIAQTVVTFVALVFFGSAQALDGEQVGIAVGRYLNYHAYVDAAKSRGCEYLYPNIQSLDAATLAVKQRHPEIFPLLKELTPQMKLSANKVIDELFEAGRSRGLDSKTICGMSISAAEKLYSSGVRPWVRSR